MTQALSQRSRMMSKHATTKFIQETMISFDFSLGIITEPTSKPRPKLNEEAWQTQKQVNEFTMQPKYTNQVLLALLDSPAIGILVESGIVKLATIRIIIFGLFGLFGRFGFGLCGLFATISVCLLRSFAGLWFLCRRSFITSCSPSSTSFGLVSTSPPGPGKANILLRYHTERMRLVE